ncbi:hypothetical protein Tco_1279511 [Tanacetum coccineum]
MLYADALIVTELTCLDDLHDLSSVEAEFPAIVINDAFAPQDTFQCKSQVSTPINDEFDFRISFDESDDGDFTIIYDTNSFSYKMISVNNLKTDSENDYEKVMPSIPSPKPAISCFDDLDFFNDFENEFPAIVYYDAQTSKSYLLTEPILSPQHIDEFNDNTSLSEYDEEEQNVLWKIGLQDMALPPCEHRHRFIRYEGLEYPDTDIVDFEGKLARIHMREVHRVPLFDFGGLPDLMAEGLTARMTMEHRDEADAESARQIPDKGDLRDYWIEISFARDFLGTTPSYTAVRDPILRLCHRLIACRIAGRSQAPEKVTVTDLFYLRGMDVGSVNVPYLLARYLRLFATGRKSGAHISGGQFVARLADHFRLLTAEILGGLTVIALELLAWVAMGPERQPDAAVGAPADAEDAPIVYEGGQADPTPVQAPQQPPLPPPPPARTISQRLGRLEEYVQGLHRDVGSLRGLVERSMTD